MKEINQMANKNAEIRIRREREVARGRKIGSERRGIREKMDGELEVVRRYVYGN